MLTKLVNIGVAVNDIDKAVAQYQETFGAEIVRPVATNPALNISFAVVRVADAEIEFFAPLPGEKVLRHFLDTRGEGLYRLAFGTDAMEEALTHLDDRGVRYSQVTNAGDGDSRIAFLSPKAGSGVMFELVEESPVPA